MLDDYIPLELMVEFSLNSIEGDIECASVAIVNDDIAEQTESFLVTLDADESTEADIEESLATHEVTIEDDDG